MSELARYTTPAERARGAVFAEGFESSGLVVSNNGTITGTPVVDFGITLDGTNDYTSYNLSGVELTYATLSFVVNFAPDFDYDEDAVRHLFDTDASGRCRVYKNNNAGANALEVVLGGTAIASISDATYSALWNVGSKNVLTVAGTTGATDAWLNGTQILTADATAWTPGSPTSLYLGANNAGAQLFDGVLHEFKAFRYLLTGAEADDYWERR